MPALTDLVGFIGLEPMDGAAVLMREHRDGARSHFDSRTEGTDRDLAAVRHKDLLEHAHLWELDAQRFRCAWGGAECSPSLGEGNVVSVHVLSVSSLKEASARRP